MKNGARWAAGWSSFRGDRRRLAMVGSGSVVIKTSTTALSTATRLASGFLVHVRQPLEGESRVW